MLNPADLGFPDEDSPTMPQVRRPFGAKKKKHAAPKATPADTAASGEHPAQPHLRHALAATDHTSKQKHVFKALGAIRRAATMTAPSAAPAGAPAASPAASPAA